MAALAALALLAIGIALLNLRAADAGVTTETAAVGETPVTVYRSSSGARAPAVVIAHGFAGSQQLMQAFATTFARNGYIAVSFDFAGHGRNPRPLAGDVTREDGTTVHLVAETARVAAFARGLGDGRVAVLGHSMASDIVVRFAQSDPEVAATIAVSMFSPAVTATTPRNLLVIVGDWEPGLKREALRAVSLATAPDDAQAGGTYGDVADGTARRGAFARGVEHVSVLYGHDSMAEALGWLDAVFGIDRGDGAPLDRRGPWILLLLAGVVLLARPLSRLLPVVTDRPAGAGLGWRNLALCLAVPAVATPLLLRVLPTHFLPVLVADYLALHFGLYGLITAGCLALVSRRHVPEARGTASYRALGLAALAAIAFGFIALVWPIDSYLTSFVLLPERYVLFAVMLVGTLLYFLSAEWLTRGDGARTGAYAASKLAFLLSLALAVALDFERLFFLIIIVPVIVLFFIVYGLFSAWAYARTGHPYVAGLANAVAFAWALTVTFPLLAG